MKYAECLSKAEEHVSLAEIACKWNEKLTCEGNAAVMQKSIAHTRISQLYLSLAQEARLSNQGT